MDDEIYGELLAMDLAERRFQKEEKLRAQRVDAFINGYRLGSDLDWFLKNMVYLDIVYSYIRDDEKNPSLPELDCMVELRRLCEPSVRHYKDCSCPICR